MDMDIKLSEQNDNHVYILCLNVYIAFNCITVKTFLSYILPYQSQDAKKWRRMNAWLMLTISWNSKATQNLMMAEQTK